MPDEFMVVSPEELATGSFLPPQMVRDLQAVATLEETAIAGLVQALRQQAGVLTEERLEHLTKGFFDDESTAESVGRTILNLRREDRHKILTLVDRWRQMREERREVLPDPQFEALRDNLDALLEDYPGLELMRKAQRLLRDTGNEFEDLIFICDLRPVFDQPQESIEGFVTLANLRIRYTRQSGQRDAFEIALTEDELSTLVEQGQRALRKLQVLHATVPELIR